MFTPLTPAQFQSALAFAEAMIPGTPNIPAADESTLRRAVDILEHTSPLLAAAWARAMVVLDRAAILNSGKPFHQLSRAQTDRLLHDWQHSPIFQGPVSVLSLFFKLAHFDHDPVFEQMGGARRLVAVAEQPRWLSQIHEGADYPDAEIECEVVVIGTGAGGAVVGRELADRGFAVLFVEEGKHYLRDAFKGSAIDAHSKFYRNFAAFGNAVIPVVMGKLVGGSTAINTGTSFRTPSWVLERWCESMQTDQFTESAMAPFFERVEAITEVQPATRKYVGPIADVFDRGGQALGWSVGPMRRNAVGCEGQGFCDFGCAAEARRSTNLSYIPPAVQKGAMVLTESTATRLIQQDGRAVGVIVKDTKGREIRVHARAVVLAAGAVPSPLWLAKNGVGKQSGQLGRNLSLHPSVGAQGLFDESIDSHKYMPQGYMCDEFLRDGILISAAQPDVNVAAVVFPTVGTPLMDRLKNVDHMAVMGPMIADEATGRVHFDFMGQPVITYSLTRQDRERLHRGLILTSELLFAAGAKTVFWGINGSPEIASRKQLEQARNRTLAASQIAAISYHPLGTCKMGKDPKSSVVGLDHQVHGVPGLFVVDGSVVQGPLGVNPQITIMAMATRAAGLIANQL
jgi:choline dehydrogenase-like flavoprotein